jgi:hypothetical protein
VFTERPILCLLSAVAAIGYLFIGFLILLSAALECARTTIVSSKSDGIEMKHALFSVKWDKAIQFSRVRDVQICSTGPLTYSVQLLTDSEKDEFVIVQSTSKADAESVCNIVGKWIEMSRSDGNSVRQKSR